MTRSPAERGPEQEWSLLLMQERSLLGISNYVELIDPTFRGAGGVD